MNDPVPVIRIVRGQPDARECAAVLVAVLSLARLTAAGQAPPGAARWHRAPLDDYRSPRSWRT